MMPLSDQDVAEFRDLYFRETGRSLPLARARLVAERLVELVARIQELGRADDSPPDTTP